MTFVTFACVFNMKSTDSSSTVALKSRFIPFNIYTGISSAVALISRVHCGQYLCHLSATGTEVHLQ